MRAAVKQARRKANLVAREDGKFGLEAADPKIPPIKAVHRTFKTNHIVLYHF